MGNGGNGARTDRATSWGGGIGLARRSARAKRSHEARLQNFWGVSHHTQSPQWVAPVCARISSALLKIRNSVLRNQNGPNNRLPYRAARCRPLFGPFKIHTGLPAPRTSTPSPTASHRRRRSTRGRAGLHNSTTSSIGSSCVTLRSNRLWFP